MKFARIGAAGKERPVVVVDGAYFDISSITPDIDGKFLGAEGRGRVAEAVGEGSLPKLGGVGSMRIGSPIARPSAVICIGMNYAAHAAESGSPPPTVPWLP